VKTVGGGVEADNGAWRTVTVVAGPTFGKQAPAPGMTGLGSPVTLQWSALPDEGYYVCWDTTDNNTCDATWWPNAAATTRAVSGLAARQELGRLHRHRDTAQDPSSTPAIGTHRRRRPLNRTASSGVTENTWYLDYRAQVSRCSTCKILQSVPEQALLASLTGPRKVTADPVFPRSAVDEL